MLCDCCTDSRRRIRVDSKLTRVDSKLNVCDCIAIRQRRCVTTINAITRLQLSQTHRTKRTSMSRRFRESEQISNSRHTRSPSEVRKSPHHKPRCQSDYVSECRTSNEKISNVPTATCLNEELRHRSSSECSKDPRLYGPLGERYLPSKPGGEGRGPGRGRPHSPGGVRGAPHCECLGFCGGVRGSGPCACLP